MSVEAWLESLGLGHLSEAFFAAGYTDCLMIQVGARSAGASKVQVFSLLKFVEVKT